MLRSIFLFTASLPMLIGVGPARAQTAASKPEAPAGTAPGMKVTELSPATRHFEIVFSKGDDVMAGLAEFAEKNNLKTSHFTAIGALDNAVIGWYDPAKRAFRTIALNEEMEIASFTGNITRDRNGKPAVHAHCVVALLSDGSTHAGHFVSGRISLTMQLFLEDAEPLTTSASKQETH